MTGRDAKAMRGSTMSDDTMASGEDTSRIADAENRTVADRLPARARPFVELARLDRPIGWWLLLWPCWWSAALAAVADHAVVDVSHLALFLVGAVAMRGAGCTYNDILDRNIDRGVARTRMRPIPSGRVSTEAATLFMLALAFVGLAVVLQFNAFTIVLAFGSLAIVAVYPLAKRVIDVPQLVLGLAFSWGALLGWPARFESLAAAPVALYVGAIFWTIGYDTVYAHQDQRDDAIIGVRSSARLFGRHSRAAIGALYGLTVASFALAVWLAGGGVLSYLGLAAFGVHLARQVRRVDPDDPASCLAAFRSNRGAGWMFFFGLVADGVLRAVA